MTGYVSIFIFLFSLFAVFHQVALTLSLYWYYWWFDVLMHFWGGVLLGLLFYIVTKSRFFSFKPKTTLVLAFLIVITVGWELFEYLIRFSINGDYILDTVIDVFLGIFGGLLVHFTVRTYTMK